MKKRRMDPVGVAAIYEYTKTNPQKGLLVREHSKMKMILTK